MDSSGFHNVTPCDLNVLKQELKSYQQRLTRMEVIAANGNRRGARPKLVRPVSN